MMVTETMSSARKMATAYPDSSFKPIFLPMTVTDAKRFCIQKPLKYSGKYLYSRFKWFQFRFAVGTRFIRSGNLNHVVAFPGELDKHLCGKCHVSFFKLHVVKGFMGDCTETRLTVAKELAVEEIIS